MTMNRAERRAANKHNRQRLPKVLTEIPRDQWPAGYSSVPHIAVYASRDYLVQVFDEGNGLKRITVNRVAIGASTWNDGITWDELQRIKAQIGYGTEWAVEVFPADDQVVNVSSMRHLWVLPEPPAFAWQKSTRLMEAHGNG